MNGAVGQVNPFKIRSDTFLAIVKGLCQHGLVTALQEGYGKGVIAFIQGLFGQLDAMMLQQVIALVI